MRMASMNAMYQNVYIIIDLSKFWRTIIQKKANGQAPADKFTIDFARLLI